MVDMNEADPATSQDAPEASAHRQRVDSFLTRVTRWAESQSDIRGVILMGSLSQGCDDELSDVDLMLVARRPGSYQSSTEWLQAWGEPKLMSVVRAPASTQVVQQAVFAGPLVVDVAFVSNMQTIGVSLLSRILEHVPKAANRLSRRLRADAHAWMSIVARGTDILVDKGGAASRIQGRPLFMNPNRFTGTTSPFGRTSGTEGVAGRPSRAQFLEVVSSFWALSLLTSKHICRRELWMAHEMSGAQMRAALLKMLEWHARSASGWAIETWYEGRRMTEWAEPRALEALGQTFGHFDAPDTWRALDASMELFRWLARETSDRLGYPYPVEAEEHVRGWVQARQEQWGGSSPAKSPW
jgi:aminoglycoside 6-adenylyltransferase